MCVAPARATSPDPKNELERELIFFKPGCDLYDYSFFVKNTSTIYEYRIKRHGTAKVDNGPSSCCAIGPTCCDEYDGVSGFVYNDCLAGDACQELSGGTLVGCCLAAASNGQIPCEATYDDDEEFELSVAATGTSDCNTGTNTNDANAYCGNASAFSSCPDWTCTSTSAVEPGCTCDNTSADCSSDPWCSTITNAKLEATAYRDASTSPPGSWVEYDPPLVLCEGFNMFSLPDVKRIPPYCPVKSSCVLSTTPAIPSCD